MKITVWEADGSRKEYEAQGGEQLLSEALRRCGVPFELPCGGRGRCRKCKAVVTGSVRPADETERALLTAEELAQGVRYVCMTVVTGDAELHRIKESAGDVILTAGELPPFVLQPLTGGLGAAVDIGTTTLAAYLYDLETGRRLATAAAPNAQASFGADVISRLQFSHEKGPQLPAETIRQALRTLLEALCGQRGKKPEELDALVLTGNTAMLYLLCGRAVDSLIAVPFEQDHCFGEVIDVPVPGRETPLRLYLPRTVSSYVGADITSAMLAVGFARETADGIDLLADVGTNGEMALFTPDGLYTCSTAAGPAFEGAGLRCGMRASAGAISRVRLEKDEIVCDVIDNVPAVGACGSGVVDALAVLLECGVLDESGRLCRKYHDYTEYIEDADGQPAFRFPGTGVLLSQADVRAIQLAKAAIAGGMLALLHAAGIRPEQVRHLLLAGGFGNCLDIRSAAAIGLIPPQLAEKAVSVGNAAGTGASLMLLDGAQRAASERMAARAVTLELSTDPYFMETYVEQMMFGTEDEE